jgi:hypothetical protein
MVDQVESWINLSRETAPGLVDYIKTLDTDQDFILEVTSCGISQGNQVLGWWRHLGGTASPGKYNAVHHILKHSKTQLNDIKTELSTIADDIVSLKFKLWVDQYGNTNMIAWWL